MNRYTDPSQLPDFQNTVITVGSFDGVHRGHRQVIAQMLRTAEQEQLTPVLISFSPHPRLVLFPDEPLSLLNTPEEQEALLEEEGVPHWAVMPFSRAFADMEAQSYVTEFLHRLFRPAVVITGFDHRFGRHRQGNLALLQDMGRSLGFRVIEIAEHLERDIAIKSSRIRSLILAGDAEAATDLLGYPYRFSGRVVKGRGHGKGLGFPTANLENTDPHKLIPGNGVYAVDVTLAGREDVFRGMMNIGHRPTISPGERSVEVHLIGVQEELTDKLLTVRLLKRLRNEKAFSGREALVEQLHLDREEALRV